jgi:hypothetical protein
MRKGFVVLILIASIISIVECNKLSDREQVKEVTVITVK